MTGYAPDTTHDQSQPGAVTDSSQPCCPTCGSQPQPGARFCGQCGTPLATAEPAASAQITIARQVGRGVALIAMAVGQLLSTVWLVVFEFTSGSPSLSGTAFVGYFGYSVAAWIICVKHPGRALLIMMAGCAAMFGLLGLADAQGWLGA